MEVLLPRSDPDGEVLPLEFVRLDLYLADEHRRVDENFIGLPVVKLFLLGDLMVGFVFGGVVESDFPFEDWEVSEGEGGKLELAVEFRLDEVIDISTGIFHEEFELLSEWES